MSAKFSSFQALSKGAVGWLRQQLGGLLLQVVITTLSMVLLVGSAVNLARLENGPISATPDHMLWSYYQSLAQSLRLQSALARYDDSAEAHAEFRWQFDLLVSRLALHTEGPQIRHAASLNLAVGLQAAFDKVMEHDPGDHDLGAHELEDLRSALEGLSDTLNLATTRAHRAYWADLAGSIQAYRHSSVLAMWFMVAAVIGVAVIGAKLIHAERRAHESRALEDALQRERERASYFRNIAAIISHQIRTPLAIIDSTAQRALRNPDLKTRPRVEGGVDRIRLNVRRALLFMDQAMLVGAVETGRARVASRIVPLGELIAMMISHEGLRDQAARLKAQPAAPIRVQCDLNLTMNVCYNIIDNALKYAPEDTVVTLSVSERGGFGVLSIEDQGPGIAPADQARVFERFERGHDNGPHSGSGLGLWVARRLMEVQGGQITLYSNGVRGTRFDVLLPLAAGGAAPRDPVDEVEVDG